MHVHVRAFFMAFLQVVVDLEFPWLAHAVEIALISRSRQSQRAAGPDTGQSPLPGHAHGHISYVPGHCRTLGHMSPDTVGHTGHR